MMSQVMPFVFLFLGSMLTTFALIIFLMEFDKSPYADGRAYWIAARWALFGAFLFCIGVWLG